MVEPPIDAPKSSEQGKQKTPLWEKLAVVIALGLLIVNFFQMRSTEKAAKAAKQSSETAQRQLEMSERPWLGVSGIEITDRKIFESIDDIPNLTIWFLVSIKNYGNTPARKVAIQPDSRSGKNVDWKASKSCEDAEETSLSQISLTKVVFPSDTVKDGQVREFTRFSTGLHNILIVCIAYQGLLGEKDIHHTKVIYDVIAQDQKNLTGGPIELRLRDVEGN